MSGLRGLEGSKGTVTECFMGSCLGEKMGLGFRV